MVAGSSNTGRATVANCLASALGLRVGQGAIVQADWTSVARDFGHNRASHPSVQTLLGCCEIDLPMVHLCLFFQMSGEDCGSYMGLPF